MFFKPKPKKEEEKAKTKRCPRCHTPLRQHFITSDVQRKRIEIDACHPGGCGGVWLQAEDFKADNRRPLLLDEELLDLNLSGKTNTKDHLPTRCPECKVIMEKHDWRESGLMIDICPECKGRWYDGNEIRPIYEVMLREHHRLDRKKPNP